jgi:D-alanyl-D-alanine carboxypeptidase
MKVSEHAAEQAPSKLGLDPGETIQVEDAIRAVVTKSANDVAVTIAETLGGDEAEFARMMTAKAHALGMARTEFHNASGLPDDDQITTARDLALLGRAIQDRFPRFYHYFSTPAFTYHGSLMRNHDHLLSEVQGVDGIKTGYTNASGFNLVTSVRRGGRHLVAVVLGGRTASARDARMRELISENIARASDRRTAPVIAEKTSPGEAAAKPHVLAAAPSSIPLPAAAPARPENAANSQPRPGSSEPIKPILVKTVSVRAGGQRTELTDSFKPAVPTAAGDLPAAPAASNPQPGSNPQAATVEDLLAQAAQPAVAQHVIVASTTSAIPATASLSQIGPPPAPSTVSATAVQTSPVQPPSAGTAGLAVRAQDTTNKSDQNPKTDTAPQPAHTAPQPAQAHSGWMIQVGALDDENEAKARLDLAQSKAADFLSHADRFTETVVKGDKTLYRARFAGFDKEQAEAACKSLKRNSIPCMALKNLHAMPWWWRCCEIIRVAGSRAGTFVCVGVASDGGE